MDLKKVLTLARVMLERLTEEDPTYIIFPDVVELERVTGRTG